LNLFSIGNYPHIGKQLLYENLLLKKLLYENMLLKKLLYENLLLKKLLCENLLLEKLLFWYNLFSNYSIAVKARALTDEP